MRTSINGALAEWTPDIWQKWYIVEPAGVVVTSANYFTPRPYQDEYARGSREEGFVYDHRGYPPLTPLAEHHICQIIIARLPAIVGVPATRST